LILMQRRRTVGAAPSAEAPPSIWRSRRRSREFVRPKANAALLSSTPDAGIATALFPPQARDWGLPSEAPLTPHAMRRLARETAERGFELAVRALNEDWHTCWDKTQVRRWAERVGQRLVAERDAEALDYDRGRYPHSPLNAPQLLAIEVDAGKVQMCDPDPQTGSRWRDDKVAVLISYVSGDGDKRPPEPLVTTHVATREDAHVLERLALVEAYRRGISKAEQVLFISDGGNWTDPLWERAFPEAKRIIDFYHASEHVYDCARALLGGWTPAAARKGEKWKTLLWEGRLDKLLRELRAAAAHLGPPQAADEPEHPRRVLTNNVAYFERHREHMDYPEYRRLGWPISSGGVEGAVKQVNKRVKGSEQFWQPMGLEAILALRALWLSTDGRWDLYWSNRPAYPKRAA